MLQCGQTSIGNVPSYMSPRRLSLEVKDNKRPVAILTSKPFVLVVMQVGIVVYKPCGSGEEDSLEMVDLTCGLQCWLLQPVGYRSKWTVGPTDTKSNALATGAPRSTQAHLHMYRVCAKCERHQPVSCCQHRVRGANAD